MQVHRVRLMPITAIMVIDVMTYAFARLDLLDRLMTKTVNSTKPKFGALERIM